MDFKDELIKKAYELYIAERNSNIDKTALTTLNNLHSSIEKWDGDTNDLQGILFYKEYLVGEHMDAIASKGAAAARVDNFKSIMNKKSTASKISELFTIRKEGPVMEGMIGRIADVNIIKHVLNHPNLEGNKPNLYIQRFLLSIFIEIMTTIADEKKLRKTAILLGKKPDNVSFERLQVQVRSSVDYSLAKQNIGHDLTKFSRAAVAYFIEEANK